MKNMRNISETQMFKLINKTTDIMSHVKKALATQDGFLEEDYVNDIIMTSERYTKSNAYLPKSALQYLKDGKIILLNPDLSNIPTSIRYIPVINGGTVRIFVNTTGILKLNPKGRTVTNGVMEIYGLLLGALGVLEVNMKQGHYMNGNIFKLYNEFFSNILYQALLRTYGLIPLEDQPKIKVVCAEYIKHGVFNGAGGANVEHLLARAGIPADIFAYIKNQFAVELTDLNKLIEVCNIILKTDDGNTEELLRQLSTYGPMVPVALEYLPYGIAIMLTGPIGYPSHNGKKMKAAVGLNGAIVGRQLYANLK